MFEKILKYNLLIAWAILVPIMSFSLGYFSSLGLPGFPEIYPSIIFYLKTFLLKMSSLDAYGKMYLVSVVIYTGLHFSFFVNFKNWMKGLFQLIYCLILAAVFLFAEKLFVLIFPLAFSLFITLLTILIGSNNEDEIEKSLYKGKPCPEVDLKIKRGNNIIDLIFSTFTAVALIFVSSAILFFETEIGVNVKRSKYTTIGYPLKDGPAHYLIWVGNQKSYWLFCGMQARIISTSKINEIIDDVEASKKVHENFCN